MSTIKVGSAVGGEEGIRVALTATSSNHQALSTVEITAFASSNKVIMTIVMGVETRPRRGQVGANGRWQPGRRRRARSRLGLIELLVNRATHPLRWQVRGTIMSRTFALWLS